MFSEDTIVAISTGPAAAGIGVVRLSGDQAKSIAETVFRSKRMKSISLTARKVHYGLIVDKERGNYLDEGMITLFSAPNSYTGEDVVELSCHGSLPILRRLVEICIALGARPASPGEFTYRAVVNGKMDLTQAEAVNRLINAETLMQAEQAVRQLDGSITSIVDDIQDRLLNLIARMEAEIDFAEEGENFVIRKNVEGEFAILKKDITTLIDSFSVADKIRDGAKVILAGRSNVGKSTLFNRILKSERSIVDHRPGTTRDFISERIDMGGMPVDLIDTAGLRKGGELIEIEGMKRTEKLVEESDLVLLIYDATQEDEDEENRLIKILENKKVPFQKIINKIDLRAKDFGNQEARVSALNDEGIENLVGKIKEHLGTRQLIAGEKLIVEKRQQQLFVQLQDYLKQAEKLFLQKAYDEIVLEELNGGMNALKQITGIGGTEEILSRIFSSFCIGK